MNDVVTTALPWVSPLTAVDEDATLVAAAQGGERAAFESLFRSHRHAMLRLASRFLDNPDDVEDAVTDAFVRAFRALPGFRGDAQFSTWLYRITVNVCIKRQRRARQLTPIASLEETDDVPAVPGVDIAFEARERRRVIRQKVNLLSPKLRAVVVLFYFEDLTCEQIGETLSLSVGTVWSRLHAAKARLSGMLQQELYV